MFLQPDGQNSYSTEPAKFWNLAGREVGNRVSANHYGFTNEELDFIINYDIKYRMGQESSEDANEGV